MRFRKLRIAFSVGCGIFCVLLIVLWARSYCWQEYFCGWVSKYRTVESISWRGWISISSGKYDPKYALVGQLPTCEVSEISTQADRTFDTSRLQVPSSGWKWEHYSRAFDSRRTIVVPSWFPVLLTATIAGIPWLSTVSRFSLRTLLIATTLVAVVLGLIVWLSR
jgi:hypothetical protein